MLMDLPPMDVDRVSPTQPFHHHKHASRLLPLHSTDAGQELTTSYCKTPPT